MQTIEYHRPHLYPRQRDIFFCEERYSIAEATTKAGKTFAALVWIYETALLDGKPGRHYWWIAPSIGQSKIAYSRCKRAVAPYEGHTSKDTTREIILPNQSTIEFKTGDDPDSLYGEDVYAAVVDEMSRVKEGAWHALRSTLTATKGPVRLIGNVKGRRNWSYLLARKAQSGAKDWRYEKLTAYDAVAAGVLDVAEIEDAKRVLPEHVFRELYLAEPSDDGGNPFGLKHIDACISDLSSRSPQVWGWDLAKSQDYTVGIALDECGEVCRFMRFQRPWKETLETISREIGNVTAVIDSTGVGDPIVEQLAREHYNVEGYNFTQQSKQKLMEGLAVSIQQREIGFPDNEIAAELREFEYQVYSTGRVRYAAPEGLHDDCVMSLALANYGLTARIPVAEDWSRKHFATDGIDSRFHVEEFN